MTNNTTSNASDFTIKPLTTSIDIITERQLLASWARAGLSDSQILKMLKLYFGEPAWMSMSKIYDCHMFTQIAQGLKFRSKDSLLETLLKCNGFGKIWKNGKDGHQPKNLKAFYTPIWHQAEENDMENLQDMQKKMHAGDAYIDNNINNKKKIYKRKISSKYAKLLQDAKNSEEREKVIADCARNLLNHIAQHDDPYNAIIKPINEETMAEIPGLYLDTSEMHPMTMATIQFFNGYIWPYLLEHNEKLMSIDSEEGQAIWLKYLIKQDFMQKKVTQAIADTKKYLAQHPGERIRQNRPISPFEYQDQASKQRFYDTLLPNGAIAQHRIPPEAPPRPSDQATWSKFTHCWKMEEMACSLAADCKSAEHQ